MEQTAMELLLAQLIDAWESEIVEFKQVDDSYSTSKIGQYFSALSNEANLHNAEKAWLIFGVDNTLTQSPVVIIDVKKINYRV